MLRLMESTTLIDKATMIWKQKLLPLATRRDVLSFFHELQSIRNRCAHPSGKTDVLIQKDELIRFVQAALNMKKLLSEELNKREELVWAEHIKRMQDE